MHMEVDEIESQSQIIQKIINKYIQLLLKVMDTDIEALSLEEYITKTSIVAKDFFDDKTKNYTCDKDNKVLLKDFGSPVILFNDLKSSTNLLKEFEKDGLECIYVAYMQYSSQLLADILDLFGGNIVECTGDGNYSIFTEEEIDENAIFREGEDFLKNDFLRFCSASQDDVKNYYQHLNYNGQNKRYSFRRLIQYPCNYTANKASIPQYIRKLFFHIFTIFNIEINKKLPSHIKTLFLTRTGCLKGACKITRIQINNHILQDKLIGSVVHQAAHQASGK